MIAARAAACLLAVLPAMPSAAEEAAYRFNWVRSILGPCCTDMGIDLEVDADGGVLVAGRRGGLDLDRDGTVDLQTFGTPDALVLKSDGDGSLGWVRGPGGQKADNANGIASDRHGGAVVVGEFTESMDTGDGRLRSAGGSDGFVMRYDAKGRTLWARALGGAAADRLDDVTTDAEGNAYVIGTIGGGVDVDGDAKAELEVTGTSAMVLASFAPDGRLRWARASAAAARVLGFAVALGPGGALYVGGHYLQGVVDVDEDGEPDGPEAVQGMNGFFARFDTDGTPRWTRTVSGDGLQGVGDLAVLDDGDLLVLGIHSGPADVDGDAAPDVEFATLGPGVIEDHLDANGFLARFDAAGALRWVRRYAASPLQLAANGSRIVMSGMYSGALDLDGDGVIERADDGDPRSEGFAAVLDGEGTIRHVFTVTGGGADQIAAAGFSPDGRELYATGFVRLGADFDGDDEIEGATVCHALGDLFLARYELPE